jgi:uncharacterized sporulation protein YeaH/YhbH (DUF444 family)
MRIMCWSSRRRRGLDESKSIVYHHLIVVYRTLEKLTRLKVVLMLRDLSTMNMRTRSLRYSHILEAIKQENNSVMVNSKDVSSIPSSPRNMMSKFFYIVLSKEPGLEFKEEVVFPDGAVYKGQMRDGIR